MEAATLTKRKTVNKMKLKKTIKNVLCRPDPVFWPVLTDEQGEELIKILEKFKVEILQFKKLHWKELHAISKENRPKPPKMKKVDDLIFGISDCARTIPTGECIAVVLDAEIQPQILVHHIIEACQLAKIPFVCLKDLKNNSLQFFGFKTCCLGVKNSDIMKELILNITAHWKTLEQPIKNKIEEKEIIISDTNLPLFKNDKPKIKFTYLYRTSKESRVFVPPSDKNVTKDAEGFKGQDFINVPIKPPGNKNEYKNMVVKRITQNPNRKRKK